jgi:hypothetical protein
MYPLYNLKLLVIVTRTRQKNNLEEYRKMLTGKLEYEMPNGNTLKFKG